MVRASEISRDQRPSRATLHLHLRVLSPVLLMPGTACLGGAEDQVWYSDHERLELRPGELIANSRADGQGLEGVDCLCCAAVRMCAV